MILNSDLKRLFQGVAGVTLGGLMLGAAMRPTLKSPDALGGPQMLMGVSAVRSASAADDGATWTAYQSQVPDYVVGTDWLKASQPQTLPANDPVVVVDIPDKSEAETGDAVEAAQTAWREPPRPSPRYPSLNGNVPDTAPDDVDDPIPS